MNYAGKVAPSFYDVASGKRGGRKRDDFWTDEKICELKNLVPDPMNYTPRQMGEILGCSRSAVIEISAAPRSALPSATACRMPLTLPASR